jgi:wyosine [tRNA(Phe)-imidazoG37] synthetase (radical SAM superfamily)
MTSAEWQELVRAWLTAGAIGEELWRRLSNAHIKDADNAILESQREMEKLTAQQGAARITLMLDANPSLRDEGALREFMKIFRGDRSVDGRDVPLRIEHIKYGAASDKR